MQEQRAQAADPRAALDDCWNRIGVRGDLSCAQLQQHVHCRNCPVHAAAALVLLDGATPSGYQALWTERIAQAKAVQHVALPSVLVFRIGQEWLALPTTVFHEVAELRPIHSLPHQRSDMVLGVANVRGELLICVSLARLLHLEQAAAPRPAAQGLVHPRLLVVGPQGLRLAIPVDEVQGIHRYRPDTLTAVPDTVAKAQAVHTRAMLPLQDRTVGCLDEQWLFDSLQRGLT